MATTAFKGTEVHTVGELPAVGSTAPAFDLTGVDLAPVRSDEITGRIVLNIFPSLDTGVCAASVRAFNKLAAGLDNTTVINVSNDLPFAQARFCGAEGIDKAIAASAFRSTFGTDYGVTMLDGPLAGLLARAVVVIGADGEVLYSGLIEEITEEPHYNIAVASLD
ncbi:thiol peroxidase [Millisia brevis]|uniref:thiol peroxidase n=1 Tax=Millisia brevis TaxID=264148 RepID=UPI00082C082C|nr:thiol peroxidase [Millisia brevis]